MINTSSKLLSALGLCTLITLGVRAQDCSWSGFSVNVGSQQTYLSLYHSGPYLYSPDTTNTLEWTIKDFQGNLIFHDSIVGNGHVGFYHAVPITDSMTVHSLLFNPLYGFVCEIEDTIFWKTTEIIPGTFTYSWALVGDNWSHSSTNVISVEAAGLPSSYKVFPSPAANDLWVDGGEKPFSMRLVNAFGQCIREVPKARGVQHVDLSNVPSGNYVIEVQSGASLERVRITKL